MSIDLLKTNNGKVVGLKVNKKSFQGLPRELCYELQNLEKQGFHLTQILKRAQEETLLEVCVGTNRMLELGIKFDKAGAINVMDKINLSFKSDLKDFVDKSTENKDFAYKLLEFLLHGINDAKIDAQTKLENKIKKETGKTIDELKGKKSSKEEKKAA